MLHTAPDGQTGPNPVVKVKLRARTGALSSLALVRLGGRVNMLERVSEWLLFGVTRWCDSRTSFRVGKRKRGYTGIDVWICGAQVVETEVRFVGWSGGQLIGCLGLRVQRGLCWRR